jgi:hypothetical protein
MPLTVLSAQGPSRYELSSVGGGRKWGVQIADYAGRIRGEVDLGCVRYVRRIGAGCARETGAGDRLQMSEDAALVVLRYRLPDGWLEQTTATTVCPGRGENEGIARAINLGSSRRRRRSAAPCPPTR